MTIFNREEAAEMILQTCRVLMEQGLIARTWGNVSARITEETFLITPSGRAYESLTPEDLVEVGIGDLRWEGNVKPSSEKGMHAGIYRLRPECGFIIHTHQPNASAVSVLGEDIDLESLPGRVICRDEERKILGGSIPCAFYGLSSTKRLAKNVARAAGEYPKSNAVLMRYHGAVCMGEDDAQALAAANTLETVCGRIYEKQTGEKLRRSAGAATQYQIHEHDGKYRIHTWTPYIMEMSRRGKTLMPYLDDMAQIGGISTRCIAQDPTIDQWRSACGGRNAVLVHEDGAICFADTPEEAEAVAIVFEKNCQAANLALKKAIPPIEKFSARLERAVYLRKYSKQRDIAAGDAASPEGEKSC
ncbi:MAG: class II aldolase/adducin family protein [Firmicutes bacterium]|nr:class II aldolase/adducin family protein [Bacillota bacterium]